jgi:hypothetical protein
MFKAMSSNKTKNSYNKMKNLQNIYLVAIYFLVILISIEVTQTVSFSQNMNEKNSFIAIFKDTLLGAIDTNVKETVIDITEKEIRAMIAKDSLISLATGNNTIWIFDTTLCGRRCYGTIFSGSNLTCIMKERYSDNLIYLYSPSDVTMSRMLNGLFIYVSENSPWLLRMKSE